MYEMCYTQLLKSKLSKVCVCTCLYANVCGTFNSMDQYLSCLGNSLGGWNRHCWWHRIWLRLDNKGGRRDKESSMIQKTDCDSLYSVHLYHLQNMFCCLHIFMICTIHESKYINLTVMQTSLPFHIFNCLQASNCVGHKSA